MVPNTITLNWSFVQEWQNAQCKEQWGKRLSGITSAFYKICLQFLIKLKAGQTFGKFGKKFVGFGQTSGKLTVKSKYGYRIILWWRSIHQVANSFLIKRWTLKFDFLHFIAFRNKPVPFCSTIYPGFLCREFATYIEFDFITDMTQIFFVTFVFTLELEPQLYMSKSLPITLWYSVCFYD